MWPDTETERDFLNFGGIAETVGEIIAQASGRPVSIGVSGAWGTGKSSMIKLVAAALDSRQPGDRDFVVVEFNAWLYQGYDDARAALMDVNATKLKSEAESRKKALDKVGDLIKRIDWLRAAKLVGPSAVAMALGLPPVGLFGDLWGFGGSATSGKFDSSTIEEGAEKVGEAGEAARGLLKAKPDDSPPKEIQALRDSFEAALEELEITLVVLIDDLDRCLPRTTISTLEAIRLFLFLKHTAFVIAADDGMIKHAVKKHFDGIDDDIATSYFDKLVQVPIRVPPLGTQEVRAYLMMLFVDASNLGDEEKEWLRAGVCEQLKKTWSGSRVDRAFVQEFHAGDLPPELLGQLDTAERLAPLMTTADGIVGNPRLIKRFLNALAIRMSVSKAQGVGVDEAVLAKMLLFERLGTEEAYRALVRAVNASEEGKPSFLVDWEKKAAAGEELTLETPWDDPFVREWLALPPKIGGRDLRGALYVSREHTPLITPEDRLSSASAGLLAALLESPDMASGLRGDFGDVAPTELAVIMDRLLERARQVQQWGVPPILEACLVVAEVDQALGKRLAAFLAGRPHNQIEPNIVPKVADHPWSESLFGGWEGGTVAKPVKAAIKKRRENGDVAK